MRKRRTNTIALFALFVVIATSSPAYARSNEKIIRGQVIGIIDGDALRVVVDSKQVRVRLAEIDAPEMKQPFGNRSKQSLSDLCFWVEAELVIRGKDQYGRKRARVICNGVDANAEQVKRGMAWVFDKHDKDPALVKLEEEARAEKRGLWLDNHSIPPWQWRKTHRY